MKIEVALEDRRVLAGAGAADRRTISDSECLPLRAEQLYNRQSPAPGVDGYVGQIRDFANFGSISTTVGGECIRLLRATGSVVTRKRSATPSPGVPFARFLA
jgi:hypothetical protein